MSARVSVIIPTCNRPFLLARVLLAVQQQNFPAELYEVVIADDGNDRATRDEVENAAVASLQNAGPAFRYISVSGSGSRGPATARNRACREAMGDIFAFTDDDTIPDRDWLARGVEAIDRGAAAVAGRIEVPLPPGRPTDYQKDVAGLAEAEFATANCFVRADVFRTVGGFDERFATAWREDSDLQFRIFDAGFPIVSAPGAVVVHPVRSAPWGVSLRQQRKSQYNALLYKTHACRYRRQIQSRPNIGYCLMTAALLACAGSLRRNRALAAKAFAFWSIMTARLTYLRLRGKKLCISHVAEMAITSALIPELSVFWRLFGAAKFRVVFV
jgi:GT2 family glycosyltransferase